MPWEVIVSTQRQALVLTSKEMLHDFPGYMDICYIFLFTICLFPLKYFWYFTEWVNDKIESVGISENSYSNYPYSSLLKTWVIYFLRLNFPVLCFCEPLRRLLWCISYFMWMLKQLSILITEVDSRFFSVNLLDENHSWIPYFPSVDISGI